MLHLRVYAAPGSATEIVRRLSDVSGMHHVVVGGTTTEGLTQIVAELDPDVADVVLDVLRKSALRADDVTLWRTDSIRPLGWSTSKSPERHGSTIWAEVAGRAGDHARIASEYLLYMAAAGVVAGVGVLTGSSILVVGAMALSPDLLPLSAAAVGLVDRRWRLTRRGIVTLFVGLGVAAAAAMLATALLRVSGRIDEGLELAETALGPSLTEIGPGSVLVALAAGMAGMLAYETVGGAAVGVAISVTTIPAAAYVGAAFALTRHEDSAEALAVLGTNVAALEVAAALTLWVQRRRTRPLTGGPVTR